MLFSQASQTQKYFLMGLHVAMGVLFNNFGIGYAVFFYLTGAVSFLMLVSGRNKNFIAELFMAYSVGAELVGRILGHVIPHGASKYSIVFFAIMAMLVTQERRKIPNIFFLFILLLVPSMLLSDLGSFQANLDQWSFYMSGPLSLAFAAIYFYNRVYTISQLRALLFVSLLPLLMVSVLLILRLPTLTEINFTDKSKYITSGGFGPNQVSLALGYGATILFFGFFLGIVITGKRWLDMAISIFFFAQSALTFSRGGILNTVLVVFLGFVIWNIYSVSKNKNNVMVASIISMAFLLIGFEYVNSLTGGALESRYLGTLEKKEKGKVGFGAGLSGRDDIADQEWNTFINNPALGVGVGMSAYERTDLFQGRIISSHTEYTRFLSEHGLFGLGANLILILFPVFMFFKEKKFYRRVLIVSFCLYSMIGMTHTAMRLGLSSFAYGFGLITLIADPVKEFDPMASSRRKYLMQQREEELI